MRTRVLLIAPVGPGVGGMISQSNDLVNALRLSSTIDLRVVDSAQRYRAYHDLLYFKRIWGGLLQAGRLLAQYIFLSVRFRPDVTHIRSSASFGLTRDILYLLIARCLGVRVYLQFHFGRLPELARRRNWEWRLVQISCWLAHGICVLDQKALAVLVARFPHRHTLLIPNGVDVKRIRDLIGQRTCSATTKVVFAGMGLPEKGLRELVAACSHLNVALEIVGPIGLGFEAELRQIASSRAGGEWITFVGEQSRDDTIRRIGAADIFALPSYTEGFPISILEALACGVPVVATDVGAVGDLLAGSDEQHVGFVVPPRDAEALRDALRRLVEDPPTRQRMGAAGYQRCVANYDFSSLVGRLTDLWRGAPSAGRGERLRHSIP